MQYPIKRGGRGLKKVYLSDLTFHPNDVLHVGETSVIYKLQDGSVLKLFSPSFLKAVRVCGVDVETKIMYTQKLPKLPEIMVPTAGVYNHNDFHGYLMPKAPGISLIQYLEGQNYEEMVNLDNYAQIFKKLVEIVKRGNAEQICFPYLCDLNHIFISKNGQISILSYDTLQVKNHLVIGESSALTNMTSLDKVKFSEGKKYTPKIDQVSLILLYFYMTFQIDLTQIGKKNPFTKQVITIEQLFDFIGLKNPELVNKVKNILKGEETEEFIEKDIQNLSQEYELTAVGPFEGQHYLKRLIKK